jgi:hypothetical protein
LYGIRGPSAGIVASRGWQHGIRFKEGFASFEQSSFKGFVFAPFSMYFRSNQFSEACFPDFVTRQG